MAVADCCSARATVTAYNDAWVTDIGLCYHHANEHYDNFPEGTYLVTENGLFYERYAYEQKEEVQTADQAFEG
jgi:hypothetical protein